MPRRVLLIPAVLIAMLAGCSTGAPAHPGSSAGPNSTSDAPSTTSGSSSSGSTSSGSASSTGSAPTSPSPTSSAQIQLETMSLPERVGQLFMVDCPSTGVGQASATAITRYHVGSVILDGNSDLGVEGTAAVVARLQKLITRGPQLFVATDQEGGEVQRLRGSGFSAIPSALEQGTQNPGQLKVNTTVWAGQLRAAGINVDLAPVLDTVPANFGSNPPIGDLDREFGHDPETVSSHGVAVTAGLAAAGVDATVKHFPGLGRVSANTDTTAGVTDSVTTRHDPYLAPFAAAIRAGAPFVMVSTAVYSRIDPTHPAAFSKTVVTGMLRDDLGFKGVVITDDVGAAKQVSGYPVGARAVDFITAGGDMVLTVDATQAAAMTQAVLAKAQSSPAFKALVDAAALRVLQAKQARGLLP
ncbi:MAG: glycoside hydrolase family 3 N-terminal domain-containing protein [Jatrophihabitantaceae bacterium]